MKPIIVQALRLYLSTLEAQSLPFYRAGDDDAVIAIQRLIDQIEDMLKRLSS